MVTEASFIEKMDRLNNSQQSIETTSSWCTLWKSDAQKLVSWWENYFVKVDQAKRLSLLYLANDVLQNSRKKGPEFVDQFYRILPRALRLILSKSDTKTRNSVTKVVKVWKDRMVFGSSGGKMLDQALEEATGAAAPSSAPAPAQQQQPQQAAGHVELNDFAGGIASAIRAADQVASEVVTLSHMMESTLANGASGAAVLPAIQQCSDALQKEMMARQQAIELLQTAIRAQEGGLEQASAQWQHCQQLFDHHQQEQQQQPAAHMQQGTGPHSNGQAAYSPSDVGVDNPAGAGAGAGAGTSGGDYEPEEFQEEALFGVETHNGDQGQGDGKEEYDAATIAAQLVNNPEALLEALASLPQDQQATVTATLAGGGGAGADEEYDPEDAFG